MFGYVLELKKPNSSTWTQLKSWVRPFTDGTTLDDTLDEGCINLSCTERSDPIPPFSKIRIRIFEDSKKVGEIIRVVGSTKRTRRTFAPNLPTRWDWKIQTLEETKLLERYICDSMTSTNYLIKNYSGGFNAVNGVVITTAADPPTARDNVIFTPYQQGTTVQYPSIYAVAQLPASDPPYYLFKWNNGNLKIVSPSGNVVFTGNWTDIHNVVLSEIGNYKVQYVGEMRCDYPAPTPPSFYNVTVEFVTGVFEHIIPRTQPTITSVCERLLSAGITRRKGIDTQKFTLDPVFAAKYVDVPAPEFSFTRQTLFEALLTVGGYIHAIPRLNGTVVTFDELGGDDEIDMSDFPKQVYCDKTQNINDFSSTIDSPAQNLLNTQDRVAGAITELGNDYITVRAEDTEIFIEDNNAIIRTSLPINQIVKLECGFIDGRSEPVGDITPYVYEASEYDVLSSFWDSAYPYSKGFALRYVQGDNKITALQTKLQYPTNVQTDLANPAIVNIIKALTGKQIPPAEIHKLAFRVTYVPIVTSRVTQRKPYGNTNGAINGAGWDNALVYNQGGNVVESTFYGDKMKGAIARLGNEVEQRTYDFRHYAQLPKCGQKLDGKYIARVDAEYDLTRIRATLTLTKDFNMLSQYVGLNSNVRMYDISEKQSVERFVNYGENIYVGDKVNRTGNPPMILDMVGMIEDTLSHKPNRKISIVTFATMDKDGNDVSYITLPVVAFAFGNSLVFTFSTYDNYGAGFQNSGEWKNRGVQRLVPYSDGLGEVETMSFSMTPGGWTPTAADQEPGGNANIYPAAGSIASTPLIFTGDNYFIIQKDSREALTIVYQAHFVANRQSIVLGAALTQSNAYVTNFSSPTRIYKLFLFKRKLNMLDGLVELKDAVAAKGEFHLNRVNGRAVLEFDPLTEMGDDTYQAWGIVELDNDQSTNGKLFVGENVDILPNVAPPAVYFTMCANE